MGETWQGHGAKMDTSVAVWRWSHLALGSVWALLGGIVSCVAPAGASEAGEIAVFSLGAYLFDITTRKSEALKGVSFQGP